MNAQLVKEGLDSPEIGELDQLTGRLESRLRGRVHDFRLLLRDRGLVLQGHARTYYAKQIAQHAVMEATPLPILANEIEVS
jgi:hypothetical protein